MMIEAVSVIEIAVLVVSCGVVLISMEGAVGCWPFADADGVEIT